LKLLLTNVNGGNQNPSAGRIAVKKTSDMSQFREGESVKVPCEIQPGAFAEENLITVNTGSEVISGFVRSEYLIKETPTRGYVKGIVLRVQGNTITVQIPGSFFTRASGIANVSQSWADSNLERTA